jgi:hypothetical protein
MYMPRLFGMEACENKMILRDSIPRWIRWALPPRWKVVTTLSAGQYFGSVKELRNTDHFSTVKPSSFEHPSHEFLVTFVRRFNEVVGLESRNGKRTPAAHPMQPPSELTTFHYMSSQRISSVYDQLPPEAFADANTQAHAWVTRAVIDTVGEHGSSESALRTMQRQLRVILSYWEQLGRLEELTSALASRRPIDPNVYYRCLADFSVEQWNPLARSLTLYAVIDGYRLTLPGSKSNFPGLSTGPDGSFEANSLMPEFFAGHVSVRLLAYVQCETIDHDDKQIRAGALCLISNPPTGEGNEPV